jgi:hypothetical protein
MANSVEVNISNHPLSREEHGIVFVVSDGEGSSASLPSARAAYAGGRAPSTSRTS